MAEEKQNNIAEIFNAEKGGIAILYDGIWGIGKTHDWNNEISPKLQAKEKYYVSLFGLKNAADIKDALLTDHFKQNQHPVWRAFVFLLFSLAAAVYLWPYRNEVFNLSPSSLYGIAGNFMILSLLVLLLAVAAWMTFSFINIIFYKYIGQSPRDILINAFIKNGSVICFDDFERLSDESAKKEALAYFSKLVKECGMKILVIANYHDPRNPSKDNNPETLYKEKVFDYCFQKTDGYDFVQEIKDKLKNYPDAQEIFLNFYTLLQADEYSPLTAKNFRICKRVLRNVKRFCKEIKSIGHLPQEYSMAVRYVIRISFLNEFGKNDQIDNSIYYNIDRDRKEPLRPEEAVELLAFNDNHNNVVYFPELKRFVFGSHYNKEKLQQELYPGEQNNLTYFEESLFAINTGSLYNMRQIDIEKQLEPVEKALNGRQESLFSEISNIIPAFSRYSYITFVLYPDNATIRIEKLFNQTVKAFNRFSNSELESLLLEIWYKYVLGNYVLGEKHQDISRYYALKFKKTLLGLLYLKAYFDPDKLYADMRSNFPAAVAQLWGLSDKMLLREGLDNLFEKDFGQYLDLLRMIAAFSETEGQAPICREINLVRLIRRELNASLDFALDQTPPKARHDIQMLQNIKQNLASIKP